MSILSFLLSFLIIIRLPLQTHFGIGRFPLCLLDERRVNSRGPWRRRKAPAEQIRSKASVRAAATACPAGEEHSILPHMRSRPWPIRMADSHSDLVVPARANPLVLCY